MAADYEIRFEPSDRRVRVEFNGAWVADSQHALILHETRQPPAYYFPREDVRMALLEKTPQVTHCPFRGNATYWTVRAGGAVAENAAWSYEEPYAEGAPIKGHVSFHPERVSAIYEGDDEIPHLAREQASAHANSIAGWLLAEAWQLKTPDRLVDGFCRCLRRHGVPLARMTVIIPTLHPQVFATVFVWREESGVRTVYEPHDVLQQPKFQASPFAPILRGAGRVRRRAHGRRQRGAPRTRADSLRHRAASGRGHLRQHRRARTVGIHGDRFRRQHRGARRVDDQDARQERSDLGGLRAGLRGKAGTARALSPQRRGRRAGAVHAADMKRMG